MQNFRYPSIGQVTAEGFGEYLDANLSTPRHNISCFAKELGEIFDAHYISLVNSGSSANLVATMVLAEKLRAENIPLEAITSAFTFPTTISSLIMAGFSVRMIDTEIDGFNMCPLALEKALQEKPTGVVCITHFLGFSAQMDKLMPIARNHGALVLQDACETMDLKDERGEQLHRLGDVTTLSFYHPHHISSYGGGAVICNSQEDYMIADSITHWGRACTCHINNDTCTAPLGQGHNFTYVRQGLNVEISELNACFGRFQLQHWAKMEQERKARYAILFEALKHVPTITVYAAPDNNCSPFVFAMTCHEKNAASIAAQLGALGIECRTLMGGVMGDQPAYQSLPSDGTPNARALAAQSFFVGMHQTLPEQDVRDMAKLTAGALRAYPKR